MMEDSSMALAQERMGLKPKEILFLNPRHKWLGNTKERLTK
jgi:predicted phosphatase